MADLSLEDYMARQFRELEPGRLLERAMDARPSGNFRYSGAGWAPQPYPGYAVVSMVAEDPGNGRLPDALQAVQAELLRLCPWEGALYALPAASFHQTVANTLSEERFLRHIVRPGLEPGYPDLVAEAFERMPVRPVRELPMRLVGLSIFGTALGVLGVFEHAADYRRVLDFRSAFYADAALQSMDIRMTRPFIGHITLAYIEADLTARQREELAAAVHQINRSAGDAMPAFDLALAGLRRYQYLSAFLREEDYPQYHL